ncbi:DUF6924 domain-containing protein [Streptomyces niphimycinicus]
MGATAAWRSWPRPSRAPDATLPSVSSDPAALRPPATRFAPPSVAAKYPQKSGYGGRTAPGSRRSRPERDARPSTGADYEHPLLVLADSEAMAAEEMPLLVIDLWDVRGRSIRVIATELWGIENNLSISNMYFEEFAESVDEDGVFRTF